MSTVRIRMGKRTVIGRAGYENGYAVIAWGRYSRLQAPTRSQVEDMLKRLYGGRIDR